MISSTHFRAGAAHVVAECGRPIAPDDSPRADGGRRGRHRNAPWAFEQGQPPASAPILCRAARVPVILPLRAPTRARGWSGGQGAHRRLLHHTANAASARSFAARSRSRWSGCTTFEVSQMPGENGVLESETRCWPRCRMISQHAAERVPRGCGSLTAHHKPPLTPAQPRAAAADSG